MVHGLDQTRGPPSPFPSIPDLVGAPASLGPMIHEAWIPELMEQALHVVQSEWPR